MLAPQRLSRRCKRETTTRTHASKRVRTSASRLRWKSTMASSSKWRGRSTGSRSCRKPSSHLPNSSAASDSLRLMRCQCTLAACRSLRTKMRPRTILFSPSSPGRNGRLASSAQTSATRITTLVRQTYVARITLKITSSETRIMRVALISTKGVEGQTKIHWLTRVIKKVSQLARIVAHLSVFSVRLSHRFRQKKPLLLELQK